MPVGLKHIVEATERIERSLAINGLHGGAKGLAVSTLAQNASSKTFLVVTSTDEKAQELIDNIRCFIHPDHLPKLRLFPASSVLPFSRLSPEPELWADRIGILNDLAQGVPLIIVAEAKALMRRVPPKSFIKNSTRTVLMREPVDPKDLCSYLADMGYEDVGMVEDEGSFARRGGIIDLWSPTKDAPVRIEFEDDRILSMRFFDPASQRSKQDITEIQLIPVRDFPFDKAARAKAAHRIRERSEESDLSTHERRAIIEAIHEGIATSGIETLMPLFHEKTSSFMDYLSENSIIILDETHDIEATANAHHDEVQDIASSTQSPERIVKPHEIVMPPDLLWTELAKFRSLHINALHIDEHVHATEPLTVKTFSNKDLRPLIESHGKDEDMLAPLVRRIHEWQGMGMRIVFTCHTEMQAERLKDLFRLHKIELIPFDEPFSAIADMRWEAVRLRINRLSSGFRWEDEKLILISDAEVFGSKSARKIPKTATPMEPFTSFAELAEGDHLVHEMHGIGRYAGLVHLDIQGEPGDYMLLEYLGGDKLYLPVYRLNLVGRYIGAGDAPPMLHRLGGTRWENARKKVSQAIRLMAQELLDIYAAREVYPGTPLPKGGAEFEEFAASFLYDETPDQAKAIEDIMFDMGTKRPMDRLVCGDVGYGKTEVAMRAAFRAAMNGMQVAVLVPTTVLAFQHYETFLKRFADYPINIEMLSRFRTSREQKKVVEELTKGRVDIVIGTHRLLQKDVSFRNLGLLIIDEEHRFGVCHKERIKKLRKTVDVMAMTATPIPRTLNLSLTGIRDISIINTPPADRQSITTYVAPLDEGIIRQAIIREMARGGQIFFVHNRIETMGSMYAKLKKIVPEARIVVGHGQLKETALEKVMMDFVEKRADVLLCTAIIESGLDIPSANTIIIHRADTFGLAQLYQLRGRVGRSSVKAYAYLLTPPDGMMTPIAKKRLTVLKRFTELGSGFQIAMHDLEFRGSGNILGSAQSGHIAVVGYELYAKLLDRAVRKLTGKKVEEEIDPELHLKISAFLPETYVSDPGSRVDLYKRLANRTSSEEVLAMGEELTDRFGPLPAEALNLLGMMEIKILARKLRMRQVLFDGAHLSCQLDATTPLSTDKILSLVHEDSSLYRIVPPDRLLIRTGKTADDSAVIAAVRNSLNALQIYVSEDGSNYA
ncbi:MAG: transcription-repair coupling factor [Pseudomonadota bacterium]